MGIHLSNFAFNTLAAMLLSHIAQKLGIQCGIHMEGIAEAMVWLHGKLTCLCGHIGSTIVAIIFTDSQFLASTPKVLETGGPAILADAPKGMHITVAKLIPVLKINSQLKSSLNRSHKLSLVNFKQLVERHHGGNGGFANTHGADFIGLDYADSNIGSNQFG